MPEKNLGGMDAADILHGGAFSFFKNQPAKTHGACSNEEPLLLAPAQAGAGRRNARRPQEVRCRPSESRKSAMRHAPSRARNVPRIAASAARRRGPSRG